jgi:hypothetical protein
MSPDWYGAEPALQHLWQIGLGEDEVHTSVQRTPRGAVGRVGGQHDGARLGGGVAPDPPDRPPIRA